MTMLWRMHGEWTRAAEPENLWLGAAWIVLLGIAIYAPVELRAGAPGPAPRSRPRASCKLSGDRMPADVGKPASSSGRARSQSARTQRHISRRVADLPCASSPMRKMRPAIQTAASALAASRSPASAGCRERGGGLDREPEQHYQRDRWREQRKGYRNRACGRDHDRSHEEDGKYLYEDAQHDEILRVLDVGTRSADGEKYPEPQSRAPRTRKSKNHTEQGGRDLDSKCEERRQQDADIEKGSAAGGGQASEQLPEHQVEGRH